MHTGIDPGLKVTALVTLDDNGNVLYKEHFGSDINPRFDRAVKIGSVSRYTMYRDALKEYFVKNAITGTVVMEDPAGKILGNARKLLEIYGVYLVALGEVTLPSKVFTPKPSEIKKFFTGQGASTKDDMINECKKRGVVPRNDHEADAFAMASMSVENYEFK